MADLSRSSEKRPEISNPPEEAPNLKVLSNLMIDDGKHRPDRKYIPGDYFKQLFPREADSRVYSDTMTKTQISESRLYLVCTICGRPCAGTCENTKINQ